MSKKKNANIAKNTQKKQEKLALNQKLENFIVKHTGIVLILAVLFTVFNNYKNSSIVGGMFVLFDILIWAGVAAVLVFAILGIVKKNPGLYKWCAVGAANSVIWFVFKNLGNFGVRQCYYAIALYFVFCLLYYIFAYTGAWNKKAVRILIYIIIVLASIAWIANIVLYIGKTGTFIGTPIF